MPNDEEEQDRMDLVNFHHPFFREKCLSALLDTSYVSLISLSLEMCITNGRKKRWLLLMRGELHKAPINNPQKVLDLGTGTGIWALDFAE
jgi:hypothetical protein